MLDKNKIYSVGAVAFIACVSLLGFWGSHYFNRTNLLKTSKDKIVSYRVIDRVPMIGDATSTPTTTPKEEVIEYRYISTEISQRKVFWDKSNSTQYSNAENLPKRPDGKTPIAFYAQSIVYKDNSVIYDIKVATATKSDFELANRLTIIDYIHSLLGDNALATSTFIVSSTYTPDQSGTIQFLEAGGAGGSGEWSSGGGAQVVTSSAYVVTSGVPITIIVGIGGLAHVGDNPAGRGTSSSIDGIVAAPGKGALANSPVAYGTGGVSGSNQPGGVGSGTGWGASGGSQSFPGINGVLNKAGDGVPGVTSSITGVALGYGASGGAGCEVNGLAGVGAPGGGDGQGQGLCVGTGSSARANSGSSSGGDQNVARSGADGVIIIAFNSSTPSGAVKGMILNFE